MRRLRHYKMLDLSSGDVFSAIATTEQEAARIISRNHSFAAVASLHTIKAWDV